MWLTILRWPWVGRESERAITRRRISEAAAPGRGRYRRALRFTSSVRQTNLSDALGRRRATRPAGPEARLAEAMRYAVLAPGKRFRPILAVASADLFGARREAALRVAAAVEFAHTYSLVHDDLPCMDDDDVRRGQPSTHIRFDALVTLLPSAFHLGNLRLELLNQRQVLLFRFTCGHIK